MPAGLLRRQRRRGRQSQAQGEGATLSNEGHDVASSWVWIVLRISASSSLVLDQIATTASMSGFTAPLTISAIGLFSPWPLWYQRLDAPAERLALVEAALQAGLEVRQAFWLSLAGERDNEASDDPVVFGLRLAVGYRTASLSSPGRRIASAAPRTSRPASARAPAGPRPPAS